MLLNGSALCMNELMCWIAIYRSIKLSVLKYALTRRPVIEFYLSIILLFYPCPL